MVMYQGDGEGQEEGRQQIIIITVPPQVGRKGRSHRRTRGTKRGPNVVLGHSHDRHEAKVVQEIKHAKKMLHALAVQGEEKAKEATRRIAKGHPPMIINDAAGRCHAMEREECAQPPPLHDITPKTNLISPAAPGEQRIRNCPKSFSVLSQSE